MKVSRSFRLASSQFIGSSKHLSIHARRYSLGFGSSSLDSTQPKQPSDLENYDVVIVGGGVVGLALANAFGSCKIVRDSGYRISVLEASDLSKIKNWSLPADQWSNRVSSVTNENLQFLKQIGALQYIDPSRTNPVERMQVWDGLSDARIVFDSLDGINSPLSYDAVPYMAKFIENVHIQKALLRNLENFSNVDVSSSTKVASILSDEADWPLIEMENGKKLRARLLVGADGFNSPVKSYSKITSTGWNYDAHCVVGTLELEPTSYNHTAWQRFLTTGPLGFLPLSDRHASLAWSTKPHIAAGLKALQSQTLASVINACYKLPHDSVNYLLNRIGSHSKSNPIDSAAIQSEIDWRSSPTILPVESTPKDELPPKVLDARMETVASFPLRMFHADQYLGTFEESIPGSPEKASRSIRTVLVGDAAHVLHPMAGQGLNLGLGDARELANIVRTAIENGQDIGGLTALVPYARSRYFANHLVMATVDKLNKLYSLDLPPIVWARSVGVEVLNEIPSLKAVMMGSAGGTAEGSTLTGQRGLWSTVADVYEGAQKVQALAQGLGSIATGAIMSGIHRATAPKS